VVPLKLIQTIKIRRHGLLDLAAKQREAFAATRDFGPVGRGRGKKFETEIENAAGGAVLGGTRY
jgi:hypothetical protein